MSRAFVKESDDAGELLPELVVSPHPNFVTPAGLALVEQRVASLEVEQRDARGGNDKPLLARINRDLRYWAHRRASAQVVPAAVAPIEVVRFGVNVALRLVDGTERTFRIVGEDEADPVRGLISWASPLGRILTGKIVGDELEVLGQTAEIVALTP